MTIPLSGGYKESFELVTVATAVAAVAAGQPELAASDMSVRLEYIWSSDGSGQGGRILDETLTNLGEAYLEKGRVKWNPPTDLDQSLVEYLSRSVEELNRRLQAGSLTIDGDGNIRPPRNVASTTTFIYPREF